MHQEWNLRTVSPAEAVCIPVAACLHLHIRQHAGLDDVRADVGEHRVHLLPQADRRHHVYASHADCVLRKMKVTSQREVCCESGMLACRPSRQTGSASNH